MTPIHSDSFFSKEVSRARVFFRERIIGSEPLNLISGGCEHCTGSYRIERDTFPYYCIELVVRGKGQLWYDQKSQQLGPGSLFIYGPKIPYRMESSSESPMVKYFADFSGDHSLRLLQSKGLKSGSLIQVPPSKTIVENFDQLIDAGLDSGAHSSRLGVLLLETLLIRCSESKIYSGSIETRSFATYQRCRAYLENHAAKLRTAEEVAKACHVDLAYMCRLFQRYARKTPYQIMIQIKMNAATDRFIQSGCLVKEVADEFGFADAYHFSRLFKKHHGISPQYFLQRHLKNHPPSQSPIKSS